MYKRFSYQLCPVSGDFEDSCSRPGIAVHFTRLADWDVASMVNSPLFVLTTIVYLLHCSGKQQVGQFSAVNGLQSRLRRWHRSLKVAGTAAAAVAKATSARRTDFAGTSMIETSIYEVSDFENVMGWLSIIKLCKVSRIIFMFHVCGDFGLRSKLGALEARGTLPRSLRWWTWGRAGQCVCRDTIERSAGLGNW